MTTTALATLKKSVKATTLADLVRVKTSEHVFMLLDCSSSMGDGMRNGQMKIDGLRDVVATIKQRQPVTMVAFGPAFDGRAVFFTDAVPKPAGSTPLHEAIDFARAQGAGRILVVSDGQPNSAFHASDAAEKFGGVIDTVFVGNPGGEGSAFLAKLAADSGGVSFEGDLSEPRELGTKIAGLLNGDVEEDDEPEPPVNW